MIGSAITENISELPYIGEHQLSFYHLRVAAVQYFSKQEYDASIEIANLGQLSRALPGVKLLGLNRLEELLNA